MSDEIGKPYPRRDGRAKVTGEAVYSYEWPVPGILYGVLVTSNLAKGRITAVDSAAAEREPGVIAVLTPFNAMKLPGGAKPADTAAASWSSPSGPASAMPSHWRQTSSRRSRAGGTPSTQRAEQAVTRFRTAPLPG